MSIRYHIKKLAPQLITSIFIMAFFISLSSARALAEDFKNPTYLYKATMLRAAPGKLMELITLLKGLKESGYYDMLEEHPPLIMRHSQGDHWDLMLLQPIESYEIYYNKKHIKLRRDFQDTILFTKNELNARVVFKEDLFAFGPNRDVIDNEFANNNLFHIEMFSALAGQHDALLTERGMENDYLIRTGQTPTFLWVGDQGANYDSFTIGFHKSMMAYADPGPATEEEKLAARIAAGFPADGDDIGAYLRRFLASHHDTLATPIR